MLCHAYALRADTRDIDDTLSPCCRYAIDSVVLAYAAA